MTIFFTNFVNDRIPEGYISLQVVPENFLQRIMQLGNAHSGTQGVGANNIPSLDVGPGSQDFKVDAVKLSSII
jgi:hypothetical protein